MAESLLESSQISKQIHIQWARTVEPILLLPLELLLEHVTEVHGLQNTKRTVIMHHKLPLKML